MKGSFDEGISIYAKSKFFVTERQHLIYADTVNQTLTKFSLRNIFHTNNCKPRKASYCTIYTNVLGIGRQKRPLMPLIWEQAAKTGLAAPLIKRLVPVIEW